MTGIEVRLPAAVDTGRAIGAQAAPEPASATAETGAPATGDGILLSNPSGLRNFLRWGGVAAGAGGVALLALKATQGGGIASVRGTPFLPLAIGAATVGAAMLGSSFLGGLQPKYRPLAASGIGDLEQAQARAVEIGDDVAIVRQDDGRFGLVQFPEKDFDNANLGNLKLDSQGVAWAGIVTRDGDFARSLGNGRWDVEGRAHPDPIAADSLSTADAGSLSGQQIGTSDSHAAATLGTVVGNSAGYSSLAAASAAAHQIPGATAIVELRGRYVLMQATLPDGVDPRELQARGTALDPVSALTIEDRLKLFRPGDAGDDFAFAGRSTPFSPGEPLGRSINGRHVERHMSSSSDRTAAYAAIRRDEALIDAVFFGRAGGAALLRTQDPDGRVGFHAYRLGSGGGSARWDQELGSVEALLQRTVRTDEDFSYHAPYGADSEWAIQHAYVRRTDLERTSVSLTDSGTLRDSGWIQVDQEIDYWATQRYRERLLEDLHYRQNPPGTSPGDDSGTGGTSPGDDSGTGGSTSPGDDGGSSGSGGSTSPGDDGGSGGSTNPGDDAGSGGSGGSTSPGDGGSSGGSGGSGDSDDDAGDSTDNGNPDESDF